MIELSFEHRQIVFDFCVNTKQLSANVFSLIQKLSWTDSSSCSIAQKKHYLQQ